MNIDDFIQNCSPIYKNILEVIEKYKELQNADIKVIDHDTEKFET
jgi:septum formation topological specificity factor MinE